MENTGPAVEKKAITFPKVPVYVTGPVAPLYQAWADIAEAYEDDPASLSNAWLYLGHHPAFWTLQDGPGGSHAYVATGGAWYQSIELGVNGDNSVWIEIQPALWPDDPEDPNDYKLGVEAATYELAAISAAVLVHQTYRNDRQFLSKAFTDKWY